MLKGNVCDPRRGGRGLYKVTLPWPSLPVMNIVLYCTVLKYGHTEGLQTDILYTENVLYCILILCTEGLHTGKLYTEVVLCCILIL